MGNPKAALELIINSLQDVDKVTAINPSQYHHYMYHIGPVMPRASLEHQRMFYTCPW